VSKQKQKLEGKTWEASRVGDSIIFKCKICGFVVRSHVKHYDVAYQEILRHIAETHAKPEY